VSVYRAGMWLYLTNLVNQLGGYLFWFVAAASVRAAALGEVAYLVSLASIASTLLALGVPTAVMRLWPATGDVRYLGGGLAFLLAASAAALLLAFWRPVLALLVAVGLLSQFYTAYFQASFNTKPVFIAAAVGQAARATAAVLLASFGPDALAATYALPGLLLIGLGASASRVRPRLFGVGELARAGVSVWFPGAVAVLGTNLGVVAAYNLAHPEVAGYVYIAQVLANAAVGVATVVTGVLLPYLSSLRERGPATVKAFRLALALSLPLASALAAGGVHFLALLGGQYAEAADALAVFVLANLAALAAQSLSSLVYAEGFYFTYLGVGVASNATRIVLYLLWGSSDVGVAGSFLVGSLVGLALYAYLRRDVARGMFAVLPRALPAAVPGLAGLFGVVPAALGAAAGYLLELRLGLVSRGELGEFARQVLPSSLYLRLAPVAARLLDLID
jgi:hypothetical protein